MYFCTKTCLVPFVKPFHSFKLKSVLYSYCLTKGISHVCAPPWFESEEVCTTKCISGNQFSSKYVIQTFLPSKSVILIIIDIDYPNISSMNMFSWIAWYCFLCIEHLIPLTNEIKHTVDYWRDVLIHYWQLRKKY